MCAIAVPAGHAAMLADLMASSRTEAKLLASRSDGDKLNQAPPRLSRLDQQEAHLRARIMNSLQRRIERSSQVSHPCCSIAVLLLVLASFCRLCNALAEAGIMHVKQASGLMLRLHALICSAAVQTEDRQSLAAAMQSMQDLGQNDFASQAMRIMDDLKLNRPAGMYALCTSWSLSLLPALVASSYVLCHATTPPLLLSAATGRQL